MSSLDPATLDASIINQETQIRQTNRLSEELTSSVTSNKDERFSLPPPIRVVLYSFSAGILGGLGGLIHGYRLAAGKYLASNSHRLPTSKNGWFFYHKRKNYYCLKNSFILGSQTFLKVGGFIGLMFSIEAGLDYARGLKDFGNTMMATSLTGFLYAWHNGMTKVQANDYIKRGGKLGIVLGLGQDIVMFVKGGEVWYLQALGIKPMKLQDRFGSSAETPQKLENV